MVCRGEQLAQQGGPENSERWSSCSCNTNEIKSSIYVYLKKYIPGEYSVVDCENNNVNNDDLKEATGEQVEEEDQAEILNDCKITIIVT